MSKNKSKRQLREADYDRQVRASLIEGMSTVDLAALMLAQEDRGWMNLGRPWIDNGNDFPDVDRVRMVEKSRRYWQMDPMSKQGVNLYSSYILGRGVELRHKQKKAQVVIDKFLADPLNSELFGPVGLSQLCDRLLVDGELFIAVWATNPARPQARTIDPLAISEIVVNPNDPLDVWYYRRDYGQNKHAYYRAAKADWGGLGEEKALREGGLDAAKVQEIKANLVDKVQVIHAPINTLGRRGYPLLTASLDWSKALRVFMEDRATITHAASQFAFKKTVKGGSKTVNAVAQAMRTATAAAGQAANPGYDPRGSVAGATIVQNDQIDTEQFKFDTGAANAETDGRMLALQFIRGVGMSEHYFGASDSGNLATATAMERPQELTLARYQLIFKGMLEAVAREVLEAAGIANTDGLDVIMPPLLNVDMPAMINALVTLAEKIPVFNTEFLWRQILATMGFKDVDDAIKQIKDELERRQAKADAISGGGQQGDKNSGGQQDQQDQQGGDGAPGQDGKSGGGGEDNPPPDNNTQKQ